MVNLTPLAFANSLILGQVSGLSCATIGDKTIFYIHGREELIVGVKQTIDSKLTPARQTGCKEKLRY